MLTILEKVGLSRRNEWVNMVQAGVASVTKEVIKEKPIDITFGTYASDLLTAANIPGLRLQEQNKAHLLRAEYARTVSANAATFSQYSQQLAILLSSTLVEEVTALNQRNGQQLEAALRNYLRILSTPSQRPSPSQTKQSQQTTLSEAEQNTIEQNIILILRRSWNELSGYNPNYEIPKAIKEAQEV